MEKKRAFARLLAATACLLLALAAPGKAGAQALSQEEIRAKMYAHIQEAFGYEQDGLVPGTLEQYKQRWAFNVRIKDHPIENDGLIVGEMNSAGDLLHIEGPTEFPLLTQVYVSLEQSDPSPEGMYAFRQTWEPRLEELAEESRKEPREDFNPRLLQAAVELIPRIALPDEKALSAEEAQRRAREQAPALLGWAPEKLDFLQVRFAAYLLSPDTKEPLYNFIFSFRKRTEAEMAGGAAERAFDKYRNDFYEAFDGRQNVPWYISVRIDAHSGRVLEAPVVLYNEDRLTSDYMDLLLR